METDHTEYQTARLHTTLATDEELIAAQREWRRLSDLKSVWLQAIEDELTDRGVES